MEANLHILMVCGLGLSLRGLDKRAKSEDTLRIWGYGTSDAVVHLSLPHPMVHGKFGGVGTYQE